MSMSKKDYELIAGVLYYTQPSTSWLNKHVQWRHTMNAMAETLEKNNPKFNRQRFIDACLGVTV